jgi:lipoate-protein ligase A
VFLHFFRGLGLHPQVHAYSGRQRVALASANCFATPSAFEILIDGRKLVGSAQRLRAAGFLQHGSIPLSPQTETLSRIYVGLSQAQVERQMTDLGTLGVWRAGAELALQAGLVRAFEAVLDARLLPGHWDAAARARVAELAAGYPLHEAGELTGLTRTA